MEMMSLYRNLAMPLFFLSVWPLLHSNFFSHAASTSPPVTYPRIIYMTGLDPNYDYGDYNDSSLPEVLTPVKTTILRQDPFCQYDPCLEHQEPCSHLSAKTGCLCPGVSGADELPRPPLIKDLLPVSEGDNMGKIEVQWCAPLSVVSGYRVVIEGKEEEAQKFEDVLRRGVVGPLEVGTKVCVEAVNNAGRSPSSMFSCKRYELTGSSDHNLLAGIIGGGLTLLLLLIITAVILWKYQICQKAKRDSTDGQGNPSYSTGGTL
ncbi:LRRN4 C-terminal-like protein [Pempheris klunzingeri]|uniref:LRRN4 C-terminal-like protein n=1 Tax=Pempheris klunzingeri TaxID=3127111 RepID=UPI00397FE90B